MDISLMVKYFSSATKCRICGLSDLMINALYYVKQQKGVFEYE